MGCFETAVLDGQFGKLNFEIPSVLFLAFSECALGCSILCPSPLAVLLVVCIGFQGGSVVLTPLVAWVFSGWACEIGIATEVRGL